MSLWTLRNVSFLLLLCCFSHVQSFLSRKRWRFQSSRHRQQTIDPGPRFTLLAPDLLRTDSEENILLMADGVTEPVTVSITVKDFSRTTMIHEDSVTLDQQNHFYALKTLQVPSDNLKREEKKNKFVYLKAEFGSFHTEERILMVSFHSGYIFIQTDKPIYNPGDTVRFRAFVSSPSFKAFDSSITIDIQNTDSVVVKHVPMMRAVDGIFADTFPLSEMVNEGAWTITAKFDHWKQNTFTSNFQVKKYVLPAFNVTITPRKPFLSLDDTELVVEISARYLYGEPVQGRAYVVFGVKINNDMIRLPAVKQVPDLSAGFVSLTMEELKRAYPDVKTLVGHSIYVKASVLTESGSDMVEAERKGIKIVESPYIVSLKDTAKFYKPGMPFDFTIQVSHHDGSPVRNVPVKVNLLDEPLIVFSGSVRATINMAAAYVPVTISVETADANLRPDQQAKHEISVSPFRTYQRNQENLLYVYTETNAVSVGQTVLLRLKIQNSDTIVREYIKHITYLVLNKGKIITAKQLNVTGQMETSLGLMVTQDMMPSFRFVAFYTVPWSNHEEVVPESLWFDVTNPCAGGLKVGPVGRPPNYRPGNTLRFQIRGDPGSKVSLVAVDNAVFLLSRERLTQRKIWDVVGHRDIGCTRGGGGDATEVFKDAGLNYASSRGFKTPTRQDLQCPSQSRRRRSAEKLQRKAQLESHYKEKLERRCCQDGLREIPMPYSCTRRSLYITEGWECMRAFRYCCATYRDQEFSTEIPTTPPPMTTPPPTTPPPTTTTARPRIPSISRKRFRFNDVVAYGRTPMLRVMESQPEVMTRSIERISPRTDVKAVMNRQEEKAKDVEEDEEDEEDDYLDENDIYLRSKFYESWLWMDVDLESRAETDGLASRSIEHPLPDSITEWGVFAISSSNQTGFCVAEPYNVRAWKEFFVDLKLPYSVARNEQIEIKAVIFNYGSEDLKVRVVLMKTAGICSVAFKDRHTQEVEVAAGSSVVVRYTIVPLEVGKLPLEVMVAGKDAVEGDVMGGDRIQKLLRVVMEGVQKTHVWTQVLNPSGGNQTFSMRKIELESVVPNSVPETFINVRGNVLADSIDNSISEDSLASLIRMPGGCVEQNLASITLPLIANLYLDRTDGWESVGVDRKAEAQRYIRRGYEKQLAYRKSDGSYPPYRRQGASTWITAYVVKVFSMAYSLVGVNQKQVCEPLLYLLKNKQQPMGTFVESNPVYATTMIGGLRGDDPKTTLTAFVLIALVEAKHAGIHCTDPSVNMEMAIRKTTQYLKRALLTGGRRPYTVAITSYALALVGKTHVNVQPLLQAAAGGGSHWPDSHNTLFTLEATGYALLALVKMGYMVEAKAPFDWLNSQRRIGGGFGSTQSTMVVLQALSEYMIRKPPAKDLSLNVNVKVTGRRDIQYYFNPNTAYAARSSRLPAERDLTVTAEGNGEGILEVVTYYNQLHEVAENMPCNDFELSVTIEDSSEKPPADVEKSYQMTIKVRALGPRDVRMVVLDISLPTGFTPENSDLEMLSNSVDRYISNFQIVDNLSDRGSLILHLFKVSHKEPEILIFRLQQNFKVGLLQPSSVTVYEYYNPDHRCSRTYTPPEDKEALTQICRENVCRCTQGDCCVSKADSENFSNKERETFACQSVHHVYQVKVLSVTESYYDKYEMEITQVIKLGEEEGVAVGDRRVFMSHGRCRDGLVLEQGSQYLVIGPRDDQWKTDKSSSGAVYMLGRNTWVERWPSPAECSTDPGLQDKCTNLEAAAEELSVRGCTL